MIAAIIVIATIYVAVRFVLSETFEKLKTAKEEILRRVWGKIETPVLKCASFQEPTESKPPEKVPKIRDMIPETKDRRPSIAAPRRRTGAVNGKMPFRQIKIKGFTRNRLRLPFMDSRNWLQGQMRNGYTSSDAIQNAMLPHEYNISLWTEHANSRLNIRSTNDSVVNMFKVPTENRNSNIFSRFFHHALFIIQRDSSRNYPDVSEKVMTSERVKTAVKTAVMEDFKDKIPDDSELVISHLSHKRRALVVLQNMRSCISSFLLKIAAWVLYKLLGRILDGIEIRQEQIDTLRRTSQDKVPIVYLPLHRSHLDYILVTFILYMNDLRAPLVAAGNNLMIPFFGSLLRGLGAFFIKRKLDPKKGKRDFVYRAILHTYMEESLKEGHSLEFFIEGGRSRTGKAVLPKAGLLSIVVDTLISGGIEDAYIVPIAMSYEKLLDGNFISEQMGKPKVMESFTSAVKGIWRTLHSNFGSVRVDFCQPFSLKEFLLAAEYSYNMSPKNLQPCSLRQNMCIFNHNVKARRRSEYGSEVVLEDHRQVIKDLADYIVYDAFNANALMSTNIVSFLFLTKHRKGTTLHQLVNSVNWLREEITKRNKAISFTGESLDLVKRACTLFGRELVDAETIQMMWSSGATDSNNMKIIFYKPAVNLPDILELQYYSNAVLPVFLSESVVVSAIFAICGEDPDKLSNNSKSLSVHRTHVIKQALELCSILQYEFLFSPPGTSLCSIFNATVDDLICSGLINVCDDNSNVIGDSAFLPTLTTDINNDNNYAIEEETDSTDQVIQITSNEDHLSMLQFLKCILSPFIESYWLVANSLPKLINSQMDEVSLLQEIKRLGQKKLNLGQIYYEECLGLDTLKNSLKLFESWKVLKNKTVNSINLFSLQPAYNAESPLKDIICRIEKYKK